MANNVDLAWALKQTNAAGELMTPTEMRERADRMDFFARRILDWNKRRNVNPGLLRVNDENVLRIIYLRMAAEHVERVGR